MKKIEQVVIVAQANEPLDEEGHFIHNNVSGRFREETSEFQKKAIDLTDVSPKMVFSVATSDDSFPAITMTEKPCADGI